MAQAGLQMGTWETGKILEVNAPAKINLFLEVLGKRPDGYHDISSLVIPVNLHDKLTFQKKDDGIELVTESEDIPAGQNNLVIKAGELLRDTFNVNAGARIHLNKSIPVGAGLGGGSSDAAATLKALNQLWELNLAPGRLLPLAEKIGADVPFFIHAMPAHVEGKGEDIRFVKNNLGQLMFVLAIPDFGISTKAVYEKTQVPAQIRNAGLLLLWKALKKVIGNWLTVIVTTGCRRRHFRLNLVWKSSTKK